MQNVFKYIQQGVPAPSLYHLRGPQPEDPWLTGQNLQLRAKMSCVYIQFPMLVFHMLKLTFSLLSSVCPHSQNTHTGQRHLLTAHSLVMNVWPLFTLQQTRMMTNDEQLTNRQVNCTGCSPYLFAQCLCPSAPSLHRMKEGSREQMAARTGRGDGTTTPE